MPELTVVLQFGQPPETTVPLLYITGEPDDTTAPPQLEQPLEYDTVDTTGAETAQPQLGAGAGAAQPQLGAGAGAEQPQLGAGVAQPQVGAGAGQQLAAGRQPRPRRPRAWLSLATTITTNIAAQAAIKKRLMEHSPVSVCFDQSRQPLTWPIKLRVSLHLVAGPVVRARDFRLTRLGNMAKF